MNVIVTGAGGYVGGHLVSRLAMAGHRVSAFYRNTHPCLNQPAAAQVHLVQADLQNPPEYNESVDVVVHAATVHPYSKSPPNVIDYLNCNVSVTKNVADLARRCSAKLFVCLSTVTIHGNVEVLELTEACPRIQPDMLGMTKYLAEKVLETYRDDMAVVILRLPGVVGPKITALGRPWLCDVLRKALVSENIPVYCKNSLFNNVIDVEEIARLIVELSRHTTPGFETYNLAASFPVPLADVVTQVIRLTESGSSIVEKVAPRSAYCINTDRLVEGIGFSAAPTTDIIERFVLGNLSSMLSPS